MKKPLTFIALFSLPLLLFAQAAFEKHVFNSSDSELHYRLLQAKDFDSDQEYPLLLFIHGAGEKVSDIEKQLVYGGDVFLNAIESTQYPSFMIFPLCPTDDNWGNAFAEHDFLEKIFSQKIK